MNKGQNAGHYQIPGTDRHTANEQEHSAAYQAYRKAWAKLPERFETAPFPLHLDLESTNLCNLRCEYCTRNEMQDALGRMEFELFKKIIDEGVQHGLASIKLNRRGEPLLHPQLSQFIRYAKDKGVLDVQFNTNGMLLDSNKAHELIDAGLDRIIFSLDGTDPEIYERMRPGAKYETVVANIKNFVTIRNKKSSAKPMTRVQMTVAEENIDEAKDYIQLWQDVVNRISFNLRRTPLKQKNDHEAVPLHEHYPCPQPWQRMAVYYNGDTVMCCGDWHKHYMLGNAYQSSIRDMWLGERLQKARELHKTGRVTDLPICKTCEYNIVREKGPLDAVLEEAVKGFF